MKPIRQWARAERPSQRHPSARTTCDRQLTPKETTLTQIGADDVEATCLKIARYFFSNFTNPHSHDWMQALSAGEDYFDHQNGPIIATLITKTIQAIRVSRRSCLVYNSPDCPDCSQILTEHERHIVAALIAMRQHRLERAQLELMLLCEGNDTAKVTMWLRELALALPSRHNSPRN